MFASALEFRELGRKKKRNFCGLKITSQSFLVQKLGDPLRRVERIARAEVEEGQRPAASASCTGSLHSRSPQQLWLSSQNQARQHISIKFKKLPLLRGYG